MPIGCDFFFSSRRRHTRLTCDWSSDVCSSDLRCTITSCGCSPPPLCGSFARKTSPGRSVSRWRSIVDRTACVAAPKWRSEERRVGKECRSRWGADHEEKKMGSLAQGGVVEDGG